MNDQALTKFRATVRRVATVVFVVSGWPTVIAAQTLPAPEQAPTKPPMTAPKEKVPAVPGLPPGSRSPGPDSANPHAGAPDVAAKAKKPQLGKVIPDSAGARAKLLDDLYAHLATAPDENAAKPFAEAIERVWLTSGSDTVAALMERAMRSVGEQRSDLALQLLSAVVDLAPDYAEGWNRRAYVFYTEGDYERSMGDLRRVLALDPNHYKALDGLGQILRQLDRKPQALKVYQQLLAVHPFWPNLQTVVDELQREVDGRGL